MGLACLMGVACVPVLWALAVAAVWLFPVLYLFPG